jgi:hypothetical protein
MHAEGVSVSLFKPIQILVEWVPPPAQKLSIENTWPLADEDVPPHQLFLYKDALEIIRLECLTVEREAVNRMATPMMFKQIEGMLKRSAGYAHSVTSIPVELTFKWEPSKPKHKCSKCGHEDEG